MSQEDDDLLMPGCNAWNYRYRRTTLEAFKRAVALLPDDAGQYVWPSYVSSELVFCDEEGVVLGLMGLHTNGVEYFDYKNPDRGYFTTIAERKGDEP